MPEKEASLEDINKRIRWQIKCLTQESERLSESDQEWAIKMETAFLAQGFLSDKQQACLDRIYTKYA